MYHDILQQRCELEKKILSNTLAIATISPTEFSFRLLEQRGYLGLVRGEVVHLLKCLRVEVMQRKTEDCYEQLPVLRGQDEYFLMPRTRILVRTGTKIDCDNRLPSMYKIGTTWASIGQQINEGRQPEILKPQTKPTWKYASPETLAMSGIYNEKDINRLRDMILFPTERSSVLNTVAMGMAGKTTNPQGVSIVNFFDKDTMEKLAKSTWDRLWASFLTFGTVSAGIIGIFMAIRLIKLLIDTIIHGYAIYHLYGFSIHLLGAVWNSVTQLLLHLGQHKQQKENKQSGELGENKQEGNNEEPLYDNVPVISERAEVQKQTKHQRSSI